MTERSLHEWTIERLSAHVDGGLTGSELDAVEDHLETCAACREVREDLEQVAGAARTLRPIEPATDLWPGIRSRIAAEGGGSASGSRGGAGRSIPLLAAAAVVLIAISASLAWWGRGAVGEAPVMAGSDAMTSPTSVRAATAGPDGPVSEALASELERLESVITDSGDRLEPGTVHVLERNLVLIERAIEDSYRALALDPENDFVRDHLERTYERKLEYLREIASIVERAG
ncbi:MAG: zf-HC2 domain-containing protein [Gemmatimonadota bacterium]